MENAPLKSAREALAKLNKGRFINGPRIARSFFESPVIDSERIVDMFEKPKWYQRTWGKIVIDIFVAVISGLAVLYFTKWF